MAYRIEIFIGFILISFCMSACYKDADILGMFVSDESVNQRFEQSLTWNSQNPAKNILVHTDEYSFLCMGDSHIGGTQNIIAFFDSAFSKNAVCVVMIGDLTEGHKKDYELLQNHLPDEDVLPSFKIAGNHDLYFGGWKHFYSSFGSSSYTFKITTPVAEDLFICLDTGSGTLGNKQLSWLKDILETQRVGCRRCIIFTHNNLFRFRRTTSTNPLTEELHVLMDLFIKHHIDMVVTGHDHKKDEQKFGNTTHIVMDALKDNVKNAGFFQLMIKNGIIEYKFFNFLR